MEDCNLGWDGQPINVGDEVFDVMNGWHGRVVASGLIAKVLVGLYEYITSPAILLTHKRSLKLDNTYGDFHHGAHLWVEQLGKDHCDDREKSVAMLDLSRILQRNVYLTLALVEGLVKRGVELNDACAFIENYSSWNYTYWIPEKYFSSLFDE